MNSCKHVIFLILILKLNLIHYLGFFLADFLSVTLMTCAELLCCASASKIELLNISCGWETPQPQTVEAHTLTRNETYQLSEQRHDKAHACGGILLCHSHRGLRRNNCFTWIILLLWLWKAIIVNHIRNLVKLSSPNINITAHWWTIICLTPDCSVSNFQICNK